MDCNALYQTPLLIDQYWDNAMNFLICSQYYGNSAYHKVISNELASQAPHEPLTRLFPVWVNGPLSRALPNVSLLTSKN